MSRPQGTLGFVGTRTEHHDDVWGETWHSGLLYPAVQTAEGTWLWRDSQWIEASGYADTFTVRDDFQEWQTDCPHEGIVPWAACATETDCVRKLRSEPRD